MFVSRILRLGNFFSVCPVWLVGQNHLIHVLMQHYMEETDELVADACYQVIPFHGSDTLYLHAFKLLAGQELEQMTGAHSDMQMSGLSPQTH